MFGHGDVDERDDRAVDHVAQLAHSASGRETASRYRCCSAVFSGRFAPAPGRRAWSASRCSPSAVHQLLVVQEGRLRGPEPFHFSQANSMRRKCDRLIPTSPRCETRNSDKRDDWHEPSVRCRTVADIRRPQTWLPIDTALDTPPLFGSPAPRGRAYHSPESRLPDSHLIELLPRTDRARPLATRGPVQVAPSKVRCEAGRPTRCASLRPLVAGHPGVEVELVDRDGIAGAQLALGVTAPSLRGPINQEAAHAATWSAASFSSAADTSPMELVALGEHLRRCVSDRGALFPMKSAAETLRRWTGARIVTIAVLFTMLSILASFVL